MYFLNIFKPKGITSFDVIRELRKRLKIRSIGHSGTLDPLACGVLQVAVGSATKLLDFLPSDKTYIAEIKFGFVSTTYDEEGEKSFVKEPKFSIDELKNVINTFVGKTQQIPPKYSAIKISGQKLCDIARKNPSQEIEIKPREIEIYSIELLDFKNDFAKIKVHCKKGVYIRSLVNDIGEKLSCGAYMTNLERVQAGKFNIENSSYLDSDLKEINPLDALDMEIFELNDEQYLKISHGNFIEINQKFKNEYILLTKNKKLVSIAKISDNLIKPKKFFGGI